MGFFGIVTAAFIGTLLAQLMWFLITAGTEEEAKEKEEEDPQEEKHYRSYDFGAVKVSHFWWPVKEEKRKE